MCLYNIPQRKEKSEERTKIAKRSIKLDECLKLFSYLGGKEVFDEIEAIKNYSNEKILQKIIEPIWNAFDDKRENTGNMANELWPSYPNLMPKN